MLSRIEESSESKTFNPLPVAVLAHNEYLSLPSPSPMRTYGLQKGSLSGGVIRYRSSPQLQAEINDKEFAAKALI